jgi:hypothetical protein
MKNINAYFKKAPSRWNVRCEGGIICFVGREWGKFPPYGNRGVLKFRVILPVYYYVFSSVMVLDIHMYLLGC